MFKLKKIDKSLRYLCLRMYMLSWFTSEEVFGGGRVNILTLFGGGITLTNPPPLHLFMHNQSDAGLFVFRLYKKI